MYTSQICIQMHEAATLYSVVAMPEMQNQSQLN